MKLTPTYFVTKWQDRFKPNTVFRIKEEDFQEFATDIADTFGVTVANVPYYVAGTTYQVGYLVRYLPAGGQEAFYYALKDGVLGAPQTGNTADWKVVPGPTTATALSQEITLVQAQGIDHTSVVAGRTYVIECPANAKGDIQLVNVRGVSNEQFDVEGTLEVAGVRTAITDFNVQAGAWTVKEYGASAAQLATKVDKEAGKTLYNDAMARAAVGAAELQLLTTNALRVRTIKLTQPVTISRVVKDTNTDYLIYQVNYFDGIRWVAGTGRLTEAAAQADMQALTYTTTPLPELLIQVVPFVVQDPSVTVLSLNY